MNKRFVRKSSHGSGSGPRSGSAGSKKSTNVADTLEFPKTLNTYLGQKGYTLYKSDLSDAFHARLREKLTACPQTNGAAFGPVEDTSYPIYRESDNKFYIPRYFGEANFGPPKSVDLPPGQDIDVPFAGSLRDIQLPVVKTYLDHVRATGTGGGGLLELPCAFGKCLAKNTPVLMHDGTIQFAQYIRLGDRLMGDDSTPRTVLSLARGRETMVQVSCKDGSYTVNRSHILSLQHAETKEIRDMEVAEVMAMPPNVAKGWKGYRVPVHFPEKTIIYDAYNMGYWLGDDDGVSAKSVEMDQDPVFRALLDNRGMKYCRHIPLEYKCNSRMVRMNVLAGILDGNATFNTFDVFLKSRNLADDVVYLARSLGFASQHKYELVRNREYYHVRIRGAHLTELAYLCKTPRKMPHPPVKDPLQYSIRLTELPEDDYYGFEIDGNRRFVLGDFSVTHNTVLSLHLIAELKKKTLVIVNKEFLMNQWIERIGEFLPSARIGRIQGPVVDIEGKDIVLGMLQSISMKDYPASTFRSFGFTIFDEVHHISSEVFSRALFKIVTPYMLGLSATMERKDGTTDVFKMFLGDVVYKGKRDEEHPVCVRAIEYAVSDAAFNEVEYDFRGNPKYSTMIVKLCEYNRRSDFIVRVVEDLRRESPDGQIMILAHNRSLLTYLHDAIVHRGFATVGYYVGGMKEADLKATESRQIVIATYAMAAEALDIKTLTTLVMATPKTDIVQSVGRILRSKHANPIVVDIVDRHDLFQKQWIQRRRFYKKCNYRIRMMGSHQYEGMCIDWEADRTWKRVFEPAAAKGGAKPGCGASGAGEDSDDEDAAPKVGKCLISIPLEEMMG